MDLSAIFKRAWETTWKHKGLWVLGVLANCSGSGSRGSSNVSRIPEYQFDGGEFPGRTSGTGFRGSLKRPGSPLPSGSFACYCSWRSFSGY